MDVPAAINEGISDLSNSSMFREHLPASEFHESSIACREPGHHRPDRFGRPGKRLAGVAHQNFGIRDRIAMNQRREFERDFDRPIVQDPAEFQRCRLPRHQPWRGSSTRSRLTMTRIGNPGRIVTDG